MIKRFKIKTFKRKKKEDIQIKFENRINIKY